jgi:hypothetical protein
LIANGEGEFDQVLVLVNNFRIKYELFKAYNGGHYGMVLIKGLTTTKGDRYLRAQHYIILTKVVNKATQIHLL